MKIGDIYYRKDCIQKLSVEIVALGPKHITIKYKRDCDLISYCINDFLHYFVAPDSWHDLIIHRKIKEIEDLEQHIKDETANLVLLKKELKRLKNEKV